MDYWWTFSNIKVKLFSTDLKNINGSCVSIHGDRGNFLPPKNSWYGGLGAVPLPRALIG